MSTQDQFGDVMNYIKHPCCILNRSSADVESGDKGATAILP